ncbi:hypothetical protein BJX76DRAFT_98134 [Aspergillus varians]
MLFIAGLPLLALAILVPFSRSRAISPSRHSQHLSARDSPSHHSQRNLFCNPLSWTADPLLWPDRHSTNHPVLSARAGSLSVALRAPSGGPFSLLTVRPSGRVSQVPTVWVWYTTTPCDPPLCRPLDSFNPSLRPSIRRCLRYLCCLC